MSADETFSRSERLLGPGALARLAGASVAVIGLGGVGSFAAEALARSGIGRLILVDFDRIEPSNLNRQLIALRSTIGRPKTEVMRERILDIDPSCEVVALTERFDATSASRILGQKLSYVVDAIDMVSSKIELVLRCREAGIPVISAMGAGDKLDPARLEVAELFATTTCPLARVMRRELRARGVNSLKVVYSREEPRRPDGRAAAGEAAADANKSFAGPAFSGPSREAADESAAAGRATSSSPDPARRRSTPGSMIFVPAAAGLLIASTVVRDLLGES